MKILKHPLTTRTLGVSQGFRALHIVDTRENDGTPSMCSFWHPSPEEIAALVDGGGIMLTVLGHMHPPVKIEVISVDGQTAADDREPSPMPPQKVENREPENVEP